MNNDIAGHRVKVTGWVTEKCVFWHNLKLAVGLCGEAGRTTKAGLILVHFDHGVQGSVPRSLLEIID